MENGATILSQAIARNAAIVLSFPSAGGLQHQKSRFLAEDEHGFWVELVPDATLDSIITAGSPVGVTFRAGPQKVSFAVPVITRRADFSAGAQTVQALQIAFPADVKATQRRSNFRVRVAQDCELSVRMWPIADHFVLRDKPLASQELVVVSIRDLSIGGIGVLLRARNADLPPLQLGDRLRIALKYKNMDEMIMEGRIRYLPPEGTPAPMRCGVQFKKLENNLEGRQNLAWLTRIVGELQHGEVRRTKLGLQAA